MTRRAFVLGGGVAGMTAAFGLADRGFRVTLLESRQWLGGRAFSFVDRHSGRRLDNGPHVMLGCYRATRALVRRLGTEDLFDQGRRLTMAYRRVGGELLRLELPRLFVPLAMPWALLRLGLPFGAKLRALFGMTTSLFGAPRSWTVADWIRRRGQRGDPARVLWEPLCRAIMNVEMDLASARDFLATLREAFSGSAGNAALWVPKAPWSAILSDPAPTALERAGVTVRTGARVIGLLREADRLARITFGSGEGLELGEADLVVAAMPWHKLGPLVPELPAQRLSGSPIVTAHVRLTGDVTLPDDGLVVALTGDGPFHFVLRTPGADPAEFAMLSGGDRSFDGMKVDAIAALARAQLQRHYPAFDKDAAAEVRISRENAATFVAGPNADEVRPRPGRLPGGPANLLVCGDWTATGLPATLEGAARSAETALGSVDSAS